MTDTRPLIPAPTPCQRAILVFVDSWYVRRPHGPGPSIPEISRAVGLKNDSGAWHHVRMLARWGLLAFEEGVARSIQPTQLGRQAVNSSASAHRLDS